MARTGAGSILAASSSVTGAGGLDWGGDGLGAEVGVTLSLGNTVLNVGVDVSSPIGSSTGLGAEIGLDLGLAAAGLNVGGETDVRLGGADLSVRVEGGSAIGSADPNVEVSVDLGLGGAGLGPGPGTDPGWEQVAFVNPGGTENSAGNDGSAQRLPSRSGLFNFFDFTKSIAGREYDTTTVRDSDPQTAEEAWQFDWSPLQMDPLAAGKEFGFAEEPFVTAEAEVLSRATVGQGSSGEAGAVGVEESNLSPQAADLIPSCAPFSTPSLEQVLQQLLDRLSNLGEELAGLGISPWAFLALAVAAGASEVVRRNLQQAQRRLVVDAVFRLVPGVSP